jgi:hypothetical protein
MSEEGSTEYWFRPRRYGHGATPSTWQGWAAIAAFVVVCAVVAIALFGLLPGGWSFILFTLFMVLAVIGFIAFVRKKTDGEWRWRWGKD